MLLNVHTSEGLKFKWFAILSLLTEVAINLPWHLVSICLLYTLQMTNVRKIVSIKKIISELYLILLRSL